MDRHTDGWTDLQTDGWTDGWMDRQTDRWMDGWMYRLNSIYPLKLYLQGG